MRNLLFKNLTSDDKKRRIIASSETFNRGGALTLIHRHFICQVRAISELNPESRPSPYLYVLKEKNKREKMEKFFCRIKGSMYVKGADRNYLVVFSHSLKILIKAVSQVVNHT